MYDLLGTTRGVDVDGEAGRVLLDLHQKCGVALYQVLKMNFSNSICSILTEIYVIEDEANIVDLRGIQHTHVR